jgi:hypothetical protein
MRIVHVALVSDAPVRRRFLFAYRGGRRTPWGPLVRRLLGSFVLLLPCSEYCREESSLYWGLNFAPKPAARAWARQRRTLTAGARP